MDIDIKRTLNPLDLLKKKSFFLFGPRAVGKSTVIRQQLPHAVKIDLLRSEMLLRLTSSPFDLEAVAESRGPLPKQAVVVIDEIQKIPALLDEVHRLIEERRWRFLLTGSSARRLKASGVNLLAGRAWVAQLLPLTSHELGDLFDLERMLLYGGLPSVYLSTDPHEELSAYVTTYINEEIKQEGLVRKLPAFLSFLKLAALTNGQMLNFATIASDVGVSAATIREYYQILEDTLIGNLVESWQGSKKRKAITTAKFYFFDTGVANRINDITSLDRHSDLYGRSLEHWIYMELTAYLSYRRGPDKIRYWRSVNKQEVDFVIGTSTAIEVKATNKVKPKDLSGRVALNEEGIFKKFFLVTHDQVETMKNGVRCLNWKTFIRELWSDSLI